MRTPVKLGLLAAAQLLAALAGQLVVLRLVGIGWQTDSYVAAQAVPMILTAVVAASLQSLWLPRLSRVADRPCVWREELGIAKGQALKVMLGLTVPMWATSGHWLTWAFPGFSEEQHSLVFRLGPPLFAVACFNAQIGMLTAGLRAREHYVAPEAWSLCATLLTLAGIAVLVPTFGVVAAAWLSATRGMVVFTALTVIAGRPPFVLRASAPSREVARQARPLVGGGVFIKSGPLVDRYWGSQGSGGDVTLLSLAQLAMSSLATILERALLAQAVPSFAKRLQDGGPAAMRGAYLRCLRNVALCVLAVGVGLVAVRPLWEPICSQVLRMAPAAAAQFWLMCVALLPSLFVSVAGTAAVSVFYAFGETKIPTLIGLAGFAVSLVLKAVLFLQFGIIGIAIGASLYLSMNMILYHTAVIRRLRRHGA